MLTTQIFNLKCEQTKLLFIEVRILNVKKLFFPITFDFFYVTSAKYSENLKFNFQHISYCEVHILHKEINQIMVDIHKKTRENLFHFFYTSHETTRENIV
jgi:hypothetical protein